MPRVVQEADRRSVAMAIETRAEVEHRVSPSCAPPEKPREDVEGARGTQWEHTCVF
jgi:hypothetical protein